MSSAAAPKPAPTDSFFLTSLRNAHAMESEAIHTLIRQLERLESYPDMAAAVRRHIEESKTQRRRLAEALDYLGESHAALKDVALGFVGNVLALAHVPAADEVIKDILASYAFEHFEIAAYKTLITVAEAVGEASAVAAARANLAEEQRMAAWLEDHITPTTLQFMALNGAERGGGGVQRPHDS